MRSSEATTDNPWVKSVWTKSRGRQIVFVDGAGNRQRLSSRSVWGYRTNQGETYRFYREDTYEVMQQGPLSIYRTEDWVGDSRREDYHFSLTPDSEIHYLDKRTCRRVFRGDSCMLMLLRQMRNGQLSDTDAHGSYGLVNAYQFCHRQQRSLTRHHPSTTVGSAKLKLDKHEKKPVD
ncbi:hypothetical protein ACAW74_28270 [Fibrella sp. WM1]|uniref:Uncharacterized protein n=1 Tax=Spirosoma sordidisoli TaxID=2502893 RepID=A0A4Q2UHF3_9BACT|nr:hypothetical protein [Spirosoma sordidisoli]RYC66740.1 hypothetical protein EQG79_28305 [Spirosoma sordidisoli]